jgi:hypothetical protein
MIPMFASALLVYLRHGYHRHWQQKSSLAMEGRHRRALDGWRLVRPRSRSSGSRAAASTARCCHGAKSACSVTGRCHPPSLLHDEVGAAGSSVAYALSATISHPQLTCLCWAPRSYRCRVIALSQHKMSLNRCGRTYAVLFCAFRFNPACRRGGCAIRGICFGKCPGLLVATVLDSVMRSSSHRLKGG